MWWSRVGACVCAAALTGAGALGELTLTGARCGELTCALDQYCSPETSRCAPCLDICDRKHHNYDSGLCVQRCQDYIHDLRFVSKTAGGGGGGAGAGGTASADDVRSLQLQAKSALIISSVLLALFVLTCLFKCWRYTKNNKNKFSWKYIKQKWPLSKSRVKQYPTDLTHHNPHAETAKSPKRELKLEMRGGATQEPAAPPRRQQPHDIDSAPRTVSTCVSTRHPAEDTTLDYSYDNMALNVTPPPANATTQHF